MRHLTILAALALSAGAAAFAGQTVLGPHRFTLPDGFTIELITTPAQVPRPIEADFDEQGRLYVTDSSGSNDKVEKQLAEKPHRVVRLEDTDGDGKFDRQVVFADKLMFPEGCLWHDGSLYVSAPPSIWKLTDTNADGVADVRVEWLPAQTLTGCANDLHGPYAGPDGFIYWCKGAFAEQTHLLGNGRKLVTRASHIFRMRPDGSGLDAVMTGGMDNPVGLAFTERGDRILSGTFFQNPEGGRRDGLIHALYGGVYGKPNDVLNGHPWTGELMPIMTHLGPAAPAGLIRYESEVFGREYRNNLFVAAFNLHKIVRSIPRPDGATYATREEDFLVSDNPDFHPTDVFEDADGSLIVVDTGGWYKLCCPTSQLYKPDVLGGIYRIRRTGAPRLTDPRGLQIAWGKLNPSGLLSLLADARPAVRNRAIRELAARGTHDRLLLSRALKSPSVPVRQGVLWALSRVSTPEAHTLVRSALRDPEEGVRAVALHGVSLWRDPLAYESLIALLGSPAQPERRAAAEALGRIGAKPAVSALLASAARPSDRALEHSLAFALIEIGDAKATAEGLRAPAPGSQRAALVALDQMGQGTLTTELVLPLLDASDAATRKTALWVIGHHPEWGGDIARWIQGRLSSDRLGEENRELAELLSRSAGSAEVQQRLVEMARQPGAQATALSAMARSRLETIPANWSEAVRAGLNSTAEANQRLALAAAGAFASARKNQAAVEKELLDWARDPKRRAELRVQALAAVPAAVAVAREDSFALLRAGLKPENPVSVRGASAGVLTRARLSEAQLRALVESLGEAGPLELSRLLGAFSRSTNESLGLAAVSALGKNKSLASLRPELIRPHFTNYPGQVGPEVEKLLAGFNTDAAQQKAHLDQLLGKIQGGDIRRGQAIFNSPKAACSACHAIGYLGGKVGPDLTRIGQIRNERDLLEAIVYPSASFVRSYEPVVVMTRSGDEFSGVLRRDAAEEVVLALGPETEQRIPRAEITDLRPGSVSVMPSGLVEQLTAQELADLMAFLKATRW